MRWLVEAVDAGLSLLSRLATTIAGRRVDLDAAATDGFGGEHDLIWGVIDFDGSLPFPDNNWWTMADDERAALLARLRSALGWVTAADAIVQPNLLTALDLPDALRVGAGLSIRALGLRAMQSA